MGGVLEGVEAASRAYLGKPARRLTAAEAALLTVLPQAPSRLRPDRYPQRARNARDKVLERMESRWGAATVADARLEPVIAQTVREPLLALCAESAANTGMVLTLALSYGGRESIARAVAALATDVAAGTLAARDVTVDALSRYLPTSILPPVDLMIRTSGEVRISNFLLWELAYAELLFVDTPWPDFRKPAFLAALHEAAGRDRRFGLVT